MGFIQAYIIQNIRLYLQNRGREEYAATLSSGYCHALAVLFCYFKITHRYDLFKLLIKNAENWQEDEKLAEYARNIRTSNQWKNIDAKLKQFLKQHPDWLNKSLIAQLNEAKINNFISQEEINFYTQGIVPEDTQMEKLINLMEVLQKFSFESRSVEAILNLIRDCDKKSELHAEMFVEKNNVTRSGIIASKHLSEILAHLPENQGILLSNTNHATAIYRENNLFSYCDSNYGVTTGDDINLLADYILKTLYQNNISPYIPIKIQRIGQPTPAIDDTKKLHELFERLSTFDPAHRVIETPSSYSATGVTPLILATIATKNVNDDVINILAKTEDASLPNGMGLSAIHYAALFHKIDFLEKLIEKNVDVNQKIKGDETVFDDVGKYLYISLAGMSPLHLASTNNCLLVVDYLLKKDVNINAVSDQGLTPLMLAAIKGHGHMVKLLLMQGADLEKKMAGDLYKNISPITLDNNKQYLERLGSVREIENYSSFNATLCAAKNNHFDIVDLLLEESGNLYVDDFEGIILRHFAKLHHNEPAMEMLVKRGADMKLDENLPQPILAKLFAWNIQHPNSNIDLNILQYSSVPNLIFSCYQMIKTEITPKEFFISLIETASRQLFPLQQTPDMGNTYTNICQHVIEELKKHDITEYHDIHSIIQQVLLMHQTENLYKPEIEFLETLKMEALQPSANIQYKA